MTIEWRHCYACRRVHDVTDACFESCGSCHISAELADLQPALEEAMGSKVPQIREQTSEFVVRCLKCKIAVAVTRCEGVPL